LNTLRDGPLVPPDAAGAFLPVPISCAPEVQTDRTVRIAPSAGWPANQAGGPSPIIPRHTGSRRPTVPEHPVRRWTSPGHI